MSFSFAQQKKTPKYQLVDYTLDTLDINTEHSDFGVSYIGKNQVVFSSPKKEKLFIRKWRGNDQPYLELYKGKLNEDGSIVDVSLYSDKLNSRYHEAEVAITEYGDGSIVYFTSNNHKQGKGIKSSEGFNNLQLYKANIVNGEYKNVVLLPFNSKEYSTGHPVLADNDKTLYFISDRPGGYGKTDIYKVDLLPDGTYGEVVNLGPKINSEGKEMFPFIDLDNIMYFSSDRPGGYGGLDVYAIPVDERKEELFLMKDPINSDKDDFAFVLKGDRHGFISSNRDGGMGDDDIYKLTFDCLQSLEGVINNKETNLGLADAKVYIYKNDKLLDSLTTNNLGEFVSDIAIECQSDYFVKATKAKYSEDSSSFTTPSTKNYTNVVRLSLVPEFVKNAIGVPIINIEPIYFDFDKSNIRPDAAEILDRVVAIMKKYPNMIIEGGSHTDSRGSFKYNESLSSRRARSTVQYIISKGISSDRISSKGYGENQLTNRCSNGVKCSKEEHQLNRRTEFKIVKE